MRIKMVSASFIVKATYVKAIRLTGFIAQITGIKDALIRRLPSRSVHWWLSLFAVHDIDAMIQLDVPWWSYSAIDEVESFLARRPNARVFEYGSGASTIWLAKRAKQVISVEHDQEWFSIISDRSISTTNIHLKLAKPDSEYNADFISKRAIGYSFKDYVTEIENAGGVFDLIVIDGRARVACLQYALRYMAPGGMIVFDNSGRNEYRHALSGVKADLNTYRGRVPALPYPDQTTLIYPILDSVKIVSSKVD